ncbi:MAG: hypothetical protein RLZZ628_3495 [Bacteroidota bacterium]|jgi:Zn-dependent protease with chaperone function
MYSLYSLLYISLTLVALLPYAKSFGIIRRPTFYKLYNSSSWDSKSISGLCLLGILFLYTIQTGSIDRLISKETQPIYEDVNNYSQQLFLNDSTKIAFITAQSLVESIGARLVDSVNKHAMPVPLRFKFKVSTDKVVLNAYSDGYGAIYMTFGLLELLKNQKEGYNYYDLVAAALSHELAHVVDRAYYDIEHSGNVPPPRRTNIIVPNLPAYIKRSDLEYFADSASTCYMKQTGFNPTGMIGLLKILESVEGEALQETTHPFLRKRIQRLMNRTSKAVVK